MIDPDSRYARLAATPLQHTDAKGRTIAYVPRRILEPFAVFETLGEVRVERGDRVDLIAARTLGSADAWWRIAEANPALDPRDLVEARHGAPGGERGPPAPAKRVTIPVPRA